jgi:hypothetical protein
LGHAGEKLMSVDATKKWCPNPFCQRTTKFKNNRNLLTQIFPTSHKNFPCAIYHLYEASDTARQRIFEHLFDSNQGTYDKYVGELLQRFVKFEEEKKELKKK